METVLSRLIAISCPDLYHFYSKNCLRSRKVFCNDRCDFSGRGQFRAHFANVLIKCDLADYTYRQFSPRGHSGYRSGNGSGSGSVSNSENAFRVGNHRG